MPLLEASPSHEGHRPQQPKNTVPEHCSFERTPALAKAAPYREIAPEGCTGTVFLDAVLGHPSGACTGTPSWNTVPPVGYDTMAA